jgi:hypothetical protein
MASLSSRYNHQCLVPGNPAVCDPVVVDREGRVQVMNDIIELASLSDLPHNREGQAPDEHIIRWKSWTGEQMPEVDGTLYHYKQSNGCDLWFKEEGD